MNLISKNRVIIQHRGRFLKTAGLLLIGMYRLY